MTTHTDDDAAKAAAERVAEISELYMHMRNVLRIWIAESADPTAKTTKLQLNKISEMESAHLLVLKAEDAFHERQNTGNADQAIVDLDAIRSEIGGKLDSLRDAIAESGVSGDVDTDPS